MTHPRFVCPHCHSPLSASAMEVAFSDLAEYRICPACDEPVFYALRPTPLVPAWLRRNPRPGEQTARGLPTGAER